MIRVTLPARINIVGSPTDAVEGAYATLTAAIELRGGAEIEDADGLRFERHAAPRDRDTVLDRPSATQEFPRGRISDPRGFDIEAAAVNALCDHCPEFADTVARQGVVVRTWTSVPASSGLAGSSVLLLAVLAAFRAHYGLDPRRYNDYVLAEIAQRAEEHEMGIVCGFADRYAPLFGDLAYLGYHGKLWHAPLGEEPSVAYEKLGALAPDLRFVVATTGVQRDSGSVHAPMRERYLRERRTGGGRMLGLARQLGETAWRGKIALLRHDLDALGQQVDRNQDLVDEMMQECGFAAGAGPEVRLLVQAARAAGALGAKLTGAGGGGAIFAIAAPGEERSLAAAVQAAAAAAGMERSEVFVVPIARTGVTIESA